MNEHIYQENQMGFNRFRNSHLQLQQRDIKINSLNIKIKMLEQKLSKCSQNQSFADYEMIKDKLKTLEAENKYYKKIFKTLNSNIDTVSQVLTAQIRAINKTSFNDIISNKKIRKQSATTKIQQLSKSMNENILNKFQQLQIVVNLLKKKYDQLKVQFLDSKDLQNQNQTLRCQLKYYVINNNHLNDLLEDCQKSKREILEKFNHLDESELQNLNGKRKQELIQLIKKLSHKLKNVTQLKNQLQSTYQLQKIKQMQKYRELWTQVKKIKNNQNAKSLSLI